MKPLESLLGLSSLLGDDLLNHFMADALAVLSVGNKPLETKISHRQVNLSRETIVAEFFQITESQTYIHQNEKISRPQTDLVNPQTLTELSFSAFP